MSPKTKECVVIALGAALIGLGFYVNEGIDRTALISTGTALLAAMLIQRPSDAHALKSQDGDE